MSKNFWAAVMLVSLVLTGSAGSFLFVAFKDISTQDVPLQKVKDTPAETIPVPPSPEGEGNLQEAAGQKDSGRKDSGQKAAAEALEPENIAPATPKKQSVKEPSSKTASQQREILFTYHNSKANEVFFIADFEDWFRKPFKKVNEKTWTYKARLNPGTYQYQYVVDGRRIRDPYNGRVSKDGKSILTVKSLNPKP